VERGKGEGEKKNEEEQEKMKKETEKVKCGKSISQSKIKDSKRSKSVKERRQMERATEYQSNPAALSLSLSIPTAPSVDWRSRIAQPTPVASHTPLTTITSLSADC
jgi:benzoyl-CoA reductase/2-hydroxyglutaryl-CoA dehydratase subunit BcrC/BadD/HgdB